MRDLARKNQETDSMPSLDSCYDLSQAVTSLPSEIAWVSLSSGPEPLRQSQEFNLYRKGASAAADQFGQRLEEFHWDRELSPQRLHQILSTRGIRGLLLPSHEPFTDWRKFPWREYAVVRFDRPFPNSQTHLVTADQMGNAMLAMEAIRQRGYRRIGYVSDENQDHEDSSLFLAGYLFDSSGLSTQHQIPPLDIGGLDSATYGKTLVAWIEKHRVEAIFTNRSELIAILQKQGVNVPGEVAVAVANVHDAHAVAGIDPQPEEIGRVGFLMLDSLINEGTGVVNIRRQMVVKGSWVDGPTLPDRR